MIDLRLDTEFSVLVPAGPTSTATNADCAQKGCTAGIRGVATPSIGYRIVVGGFGGKRAWPIAITPSLGYALGAQRTNREYGASAADAATPSTWGQLAPGLTLSMWAFEVRGRVRVPIDGTTPPTIELNAGIYF